MTESKWNTKFSKLLVLSFLLILLPIVNATSFGYNYLDNNPSGNITNEYINNTYINQTLELNSTQFETGEPATIKQSWLTTFIESVSKWANYYTKSEIDNRYSNNTGDQDLSGLVPYTGATGNVDLGVNDLNVGITASYFWRWFSFDRNTKPDLSGYYIKAYGVSSSSASTNSKSVTIPDSYNVGRRILQLNSLMVQQQLKNGY